MPDLDHAALEAAARKFDAAGQLNMFVGTSVILALLEERKRLVEKCAALQQQAQIQAQEMRTQRATVREAYQVCTGATGEPGDWNGAEPIRALAARATVAEAERDRMKAALWKAAVRLEILTGRARGCHAETGRHELMDEAEMFCTEAREALGGWCPPGTDRAALTREKEPKP